MWPNKYRVGNLGWPNHQCVNQSFALHCFLFLSVWWTDKDFYFINPPLYTEDERECISWTRPSSSSISIYSVHQSCFKTVQQHSQFWSKYFKETLLHWQMVAEFRLTDPATINWGQRRVSPKYSDQERGCRWTVWNHFWFLLSTKHAAFVMSFL